MKQELGGNIMNLDLHNVKKAYSNIIAVDGVNIQFKEGVYGLLGANGAGKSTLMKIICGLVPSTSGHIFYNEQNIQKLGENYSKVLGYLPQEFGYYPEFTIRDFLLYLASVKGIEKNHKKTVDAAIEMVALKEKQNCKIKTLSGGMKRRVGIAQAILNDPKVVILDEPTAGLDPKERIRFRNLISELSSERIVILSTHIVSDIESIANQIVLMKEGKIIDTGTSEKLLKTIDGAVWECKVELQQLDKFQLDRKVSNVKVENDFALCRVISQEKPYANAYNVIPQLEDLYIFHFNDNEEGEMNDNKI